MYRTKRFSVLLALAVLVAGVAMFMSGPRIGLAEEPPGNSGRQPSSSSLPLPTPVAIDPDLLSPSTPVFECYALRGGDDPNVVARLTTQTFGADLVRVRNLTAMCENGLKYSPEIVVTPAPDSSLPPVIFACYRLQFGNTPGDTYIVSTENFGEDKVAIGQSNLMCEQGAKHLGDEHGVMPPNPRVLQCFTLKEGDDPNAKKTIVTDNFGVDKVIVRTAVMLCETAQKERILSTGLLEVTGVASGSAFVCYRLQDGDIPNKPAVLQTKNFGRDQVRIGQGVIMCEPGKMAPVFDLPSSAASDLPRIDGLELE